jgi:hypothetical protein
MSKLSEQLREIKVFNNWDILVRFGDINDVVIEYTGRLPGRLAWANINSTRVWSPRANPKLDRPSGAQTTCQKQFIGKRTVSMPAAINWAVTEFGHKFAPSPHGGYIPMHVLVAVKNAVKKRKTS